MTGLDVLEASNFAELQNKRIGLITNYTGVDRRASVTIDAMRARASRCYSVFARSIGLARKRDSQSIAAPHDRSASW